MSQELMAILNQMAVFAVLIAIGFVSGKAGVLSEERQEGLSRLIVRVILPAMIVTTLPAAGSREDIFASLPFVIASVIVMCLLFVTGRLTGWLFKLPSETRGVHTAVSMFGNCGFLGLPLMLAVFGEKGSLIMSLFLIVDQCFLWTTGAVLVSVSKKKENNSPGRFKMSLKTVLSPTIIALLISVIFIFAGYQPQGVVFDAIKGLGASSRYLALLYIGSTLISFNPRGVIKKPALFVLVLVKMIILPVAIYFASGLFPFRFDRELRLILSLASGLPVMLTMSVMARNAGSDHEYAREATLLTNLACIGTIPLVMLICS